MARWQKGSLRRERRANDNEVWVYRFTTIRGSDGKRVERNRVIGSTREFTSASSVWAEINRLDLLTAINNKPDYKSPKVTFGLLADRFIADELGEKHLLTKRAPSTKRTYRMYLNLYLKPQWSSHIATKIDHVEIQKWLQQIQQKNELSNPTIHRLKQLMALVCAHGHWCHLIPNECNPLRLVKTTSISAYEAKTIEPPDAYRIFCELKGAPKALVLLLTITGLRISEALALKWQDIDTRNELIHVRRSWTMGRLGETKSAASKVAIPCSPLLGEYLDGWRQETTYAGETDWVFASFKQKGATPRSGGIMVHDYIKKAALELGLIKPGERFGAHNLRHSLATFLVALRCDPKTVQGLLRHSNVTTTLGLYAHGRNSDRLAAQGAMISAFLPPATSTVQ